MTCAGLKGRCFLELKSVLLEVGYIKKWPKFAYLKSKVLHLKFRVMWDGVYNDHLSKFFLSNKPDNNLWYFTNFSYHFIWFFLAHLVYQPKSLIQSCFVHHCWCWHCHHWCWHHLCIPPWHRVRHRNFIFDIHMHVYPPFMHIKYLMILTCSF